MYLCGKSGGKSNGREDEKMPSSQKSCWKGGRWGVFVLFSPRVTQGVAPELGAANEAPIYALVRLQGYAAQPDFTPRHPSDPTALHSHPHPLAHLPAPNARLLYKRTGERGRNNKGRGDKRIGKRRIRVIKADSWKGNG